QAGCATALGEDFAHAVAGRFGRDHRHVYGIRGLDLPEANVEAMREHQRIAGLEVRFDVPLVDLSLDRVWDQDHGDLGRLDRIRHAHHGQAVGFGLGFGFAALVQADHDLNAAVAEIKRVRVSLAAVTNNRYRLAIQQGQIGVTVII